MELIETTTLEQYRAAGGKSDSAANQTICDQLIEHNVDRCCSMLIDSIAKSEVVQKAFGIDFDTLLEVCQKIDYEQAVEEWIDDADGDDLYIRDLIPKCPAGARTVKKDRIRAKAALAEMPDSDVQILYHDLRLGADPNEALEHWIVDPFFARELAKYGEMVSNDVTPDGWWVWGRCTAGQRISMDYVIQQIAAGMQILVGQKHSWEEHK